MLIGLRVAFKPTKSTLEKTMKHRQFIQSTTAFGRKVDEFIRNPAIKDHPLRQVSKHVWMIFSPEGFPTSENQGMMCNISVVNTRNSLVIIDSGASVQIGEMVIRQIKAELKFGDGSNIYTRNGRMLSEREELLQRMASCNASLNSGLFPEEELGIAAWLNQRNYHFDQ
jgi:hypothetical protein